MKDLPPIIAQLFDEILKYRVDPAGEHYGITQDRLREQIAMLHTDTIHAVDSDGKVDYNPILQSFVMGCGGQITYWDKTAENMTPVVVRGVTKRKVMEACRAHGRDFYYIDTGYFGNPVKGKLYHRITRNDVQYFGPIMDRPDDRLAQTGIGFKKFRGGTNILLAPPSQKLLMMYDIDLETGSGSIYSTTEDLLKWLKAIKNKTLFDITALEAPYGWGARVFFNDRRAIVQSGFLNGYTAYIACYPAEELYIIALSNISSNFNEDSGKDLAAIFFNQSYTLPPVRRTIPIEDLQVYTGKYSWPGYKDFLIEKKGDAIYWRFTDEKVGSPLAPVAKDVFILRLMNTRIMFKKDGTHVNALDFYQGKDATTCKRIE